MNIVTMHDWYVIAMGIFILTVSAYGAPVCSCTGNASMSVRTNTVCPSPFFITPTTPKHFQDGLS